MDKKQIVGRRAFAALLILLFFAYPMPVRTAGQESTEDSMESEDSIYSLDEEDLEAFLDFVKEKLGVEALDGENGLREAIEAGEGIGSGLAEGFEEFYEEYQQKLADSAQEALQKQVVEPAAEAAKSAVENTAKTFWQDLKDSVVSFFKNIFAAIRGENG